MKGNLVLENDFSWSIEYQKNLSSNVIQFKKVKLHPDDFIYDNFEGKEVEFEIEVIPNKEGINEPVGRITTPDVDQKLDRILKEFGDSIIMKNIEKWDEILEEHKSLKKDQLIKILKENYYAPLKITK